MLFTLIICVTWYFCCILNVSFSLLNLVLVHRYLGIFGRPWTASLKQCVNSRQIHVQCVSSSQIHVQCVNVLWLYRYRLGFPSAPVKFVWILNQESVDYVFKCRDCFSVVPYLENILISVWWLDLLFCVNITQFNRRK